MNVHSQLDLKEISPHYEEKELAYFAGFFDGEGNINIQHQNKTKNHDYEQYYLRVCVSQKDPKILHVFKTMFNGNVPPSKKGDNQWVVYSQNASDFLKIIKPYLRLKQEECLIAIRFQKLVRIHHGKMTPTPQSLLEKQAQLYKELRLVKYKRKKLI